VPNMSATFQSAASYLSSSPDASKVSNDVKLEVDAYPTCVYAQSTD